MLSSMGSLPFHIASDPSAGRNRSAEILAAVSSIVILCVALSVLHAKIAGLSFDVVVTQIRSISTLAWIASIVFAIGSYAMHSAYDVAALRYVDRPMPYRRSALVSFMARAIGNNAAIAGQSGASLRQRLYSQSGLSASDITRIVAFIRVTAVLGASALIGLALVFLPSSTDLDGQPWGIPGLAGGAFVALPLVYLAIAFLRRTPIKIGVWKVVLPAPRIALMQLGTSFIEILFATASLYVLLAPTLSIGLLPFACVYLLAKAASLISRVPGGIGVFEAVLFALLPQIAPTALLGAIIVYRCIYYAAPIVIAWILVLHRQLRKSAWGGKETDSHATDWLSAIAPRVMGTLVFLAGIVLLVTAAIPAGESRITFISGSLPLPVVELSQVACSIVGVALLIFSRGLFRRLHTAYLGALSALLIGIVMSLLKGLDFEVALLIGAIAIALDLTHNHFHRRGSIEAEHFSVHWVASIVSAIGFALWVGLVGHSDVTYSHELWSHFAVDAEASRSLRSSAVAVLTVVSFPVWVMLRRATVNSTTSAPPEDDDVIQSALAETSQVSANLALLGDKRFLWSDDKRAFLMYQVSGDSWIAFGEPIGPSAYRDELGWAFLDLVNQHHGRPVFFQVGEERQSIYIDLGLTLSKIGEEGRVWLREFSLDGERQSSLRETVNAVKDCGAELEIVRKEAVATILDDLRRVSDGWLADKYANEKRFSLGSFSKEYIVNFDCAVVRVDGVIVAFANLWPARAGKEIAVDLMRYDQLAPKGIMDFLFVEVMLWAKANAYQWFNLGMAPASASKQQALEPLWQKLDNVSCGHGDNFYDLEGLRKYKDHFNPVWRPRYLACRQGWRHLPQALLETSRMVSGGVAGMFAKT